MSARLWVDRSARGPFHENVGILAGVAGPGSVIDWLLDSDPSIRWQVMRDLMDAPEPRVEGAAGQGGDRGLGGQTSLVPGRGRAVGGRCLPAR